MKRRERRDIRRQVSELLRDVEIPDPFDVREFCDRLAVVRGRPIVLCAAELPPEEPCGWWWRARKADYVFYERKTSAIHREHIIVHEIGHVLFDHEGGQISPANAMERLFPHLEPALVARMLQSAPATRVLNRTVYDEEAEVIAETAATMVLELANRWRPKPQWIAPAQGAELRGRVGETLEPVRPRWR